MVLSCLALTVKSQGEFEIEKEERTKEDLLSLFDKFVHLEREVRREVNKQVKNNKEIFPIMISHLRPYVDDNINLKGVQDVDELFDKIEPCYDFLDCKIIVVLSEQYTTPDISQRVKDHSTAAMEFRESGPIVALREGLREVYIPYVKCGSNEAPNVIIKLNNAWDKVATKALYTLINHLLPMEDKTSLLKHIKIFPGSVIIEYFLHESKTLLLATYIRGKLNFFPFVGVFEIQIKREVVLSQKENINFNFNTALLDAATVGHFEAVEFLVTVVNANYCNEKRDTALIIASENGHYQVVELLLNQQADPNIQNNNGATALHIASQNGHYQVVELLLNQQADPNIRNNNGATALYIASKRGYYQVVELLLNQQADPNIKEYEDCTALIGQVVELQQQVYLNNKDGWTELMIPSQKDHFKVMEVAPKQQANTNI